ncbi:MAG: hypothetical protein HKN87_05905 [Saprospiraceae bacterium]|nr:hypothetical protein [Saprospiraceae bacterium]
MKESRKSKIELCFIVFGIIVGIVGILHGCAELLKGSALIQSHSVEALPYNWPNSEFYTLMKGAPVFSLLIDIPHYVLGLLAVSISVALIVFSANFFKLNFKGILLFALLSVGIYLFGAGEGTPIAISFPLVIFGTILLLSPKKKERKTSTKRMISYGFIVFYVLQISSWVLFFPGLFVLSFYQEIPQWLFLFDFMIMPVSILGAGIFGLLFDKTLEGVKLE